MNKEFTQLNHRTGEEQVVVIGDRGGWHTCQTGQLSPYTIYNLHVFKNYFRCSNEELAMIKLKYGVPKPSFLRRPVIFSAGRI